MRRVLALLTLAAAATAGDPATAAAQAVTFQADPAHTGFVREPRVAPPLRRAWARSFPSTFSYAVIAEGKVFVVARTSADREGIELVALSARDGRTLWRRAISTTYVGHPAYDAGVVFVATPGYPPGEGVGAFSAATGAPLWATGRTLRSSGPPVATGGDVYLAESDGVSAYRAADGVRRWFSPTESGGSGGPAVAGDAVYASFACPDVFAFRRGDGGLIWHPQNPCHGGGGSTPVLHGGRLYVREDDDFPPGDVYDAATGAILGPMRSDLPPAFGGGLKLYADAQIRSQHQLHGHTLVASGADGRVHWRFRGDGYLNSAPLIVGRTVYVGSGGGRLYGLSLARGRAVWRADLGRPVPAPSEGIGMTTGLAAGEGILVVPAHRRLVAFRSR